MNPVVRLETINPVVMATSPTFFRDTFAPRDTVVGF